MNFSYIGLAIFLFLTASLHAKLEIEIEGKHGWAEKLPTKKFRGPLISFFSEHGYMTGFHLYSFLFVCAILHFPIFFFRLWSINAEFTVIGFALLHFIVEDFLWFVYNPHFGINKFSRTYIPWHKRWIFGLPASYWIAIPTGILLLFIIRV